MREQDVHVTTAGCSAAVAPANGCHIVLVLLLYMTLEDCFKSCHLLSWYPLLKVFKMPEKKNSSPFQYNQWQSRHITHELRFLADGTNIFSLFRIN